MEKANVTLYTVIGVPECIPAAIERLFAPVTKTISREKEKTTVTLQDDTTIVFHLSHIHDKSGFIEMHTEGMAGYFAQAPANHPALK